MATLIPISSSLDREDLPGVSDQRGFQEPQEVQVCQAPLAPQAREVSGGSQECQDSQDYQ